MFIDYIFIPVCSIRRIEIISIMNYDISYFDM